MLLDKITVSIDTVPIVSDFSLTLKPGSVHALMGPNGSGKSSLAYALAGHPRYTMSAGQFLFEDKNLTYSVPDERARAGIFLACQQPITLPGVSILSFVTEAYNAIHQTQETLSDMRERILQAFSLLGLPATFIDRSVHEGFSGGEKKRFEMVQALILKPRVVILDEIDSGLDINAFSLVASCLDRMRQENAQLRILLITHYPRLLDRIQPDFVHIMAKGRLVASGAMALVHYIEEKGYTPPYGNAL